MPNWCEGTLKVRGTIDNLKRFIFDGLSVVKDRSLLKVSDVFSYEEDQIYFYIDSIPYALYFKESSRAFCEPDYIEIEVETPGEETILLLPFKQAWAIRAEELTNICARYNVDMKIQGFEMGQQFSQLIEIIDGKICKNEFIEYDDWDWDCPCPELGG